MNIAGSQGGIYGELFMPEGKAVAPLIIMSHGFGGTHEGYRDYTEYFQAQGFATYAFDFCGGGYGSRSEGSVLNMSVLTEADDLQAILDTFVEDERFSDIFLWGQSQGGFVSAYAAAKNPELVDAVVLEYPAFVIRDDALGRANQDGSFDEQENLMGIIIGRRYGEDAVSFDIYDMMGTYDKDVLILHGDRDGIVPLSYSEQAETVFPSAKLQIMSGQGHGFTGASRQEAMEEEASFFGSHSTKIQD